MGRRGHSKKLYKRKSRLDIRKLAISNRIVDRWNSLSECCVTHNSINAEPRHMAAVCLTHTAANEKLQNIKRFAHAQSVCFDFTVCRDR